MREGYALNCPLEAHIKTADGGKLEPCFALVVDEADSGLVIDTVKRAEDSDETIIRLYEPMGGRATAALRFRRPLAHNCRTNHGETDQGECLVFDADGTLAISAKPYEIITLKVAFAEMGE